jgi:hypothetical protein
MDLSQEAAAGGATERAAAGAGIVLLTLASAQFLMTLDSSVMNVSIATVAKDVGTTVTGIQTAITFYTLVMASLMITRGKLGQILGRKARLRYRVRHLPVRVADHRAGTKSGRVDCGMVGPGRCRGRADHADGRRAGRGELRP